MKMTTVARINAWALKILDDGLGRDIYTAGPGNDIVRSRDGLREVIRCGTGIDTVIADRLDAAIGCEHVLRR